MRGQVLCRCRARVRAVDLAGPGETVSALKKRALALSGVREPAAETWTRIVHEGRWLADESSTLAEAGVGPGSTVELAVSPHCVDWRCGRSNTEDHERSI